MTETPIYLSRYDHSRLRDILDSATCANPAHGLAGELGRAIVLPAHARVPATLATVDSRVLIENLGTGEIREVALVLPGHSHPADVAVSVLEDLGTALLGCSVGDVVTVPGNGRATSMKLLRVVQSPLAGAAARLPVN
ncbi:MAG: GreA/GreB family elongation factor [Opitutaceae bacterium]|nr:GreA/GreB family elongation factor [Opitutaceae bacterium]